VKHKINLSSVQQDFLEKLLPLWPALKGSLAQVHKPCIRPNCPTCASGRKHPNYLLAFTHKGKRRSLYVPLAMVQILKRALANGRRIEQLLYDMGPALLREYRRKHPAKTGPAAQLNPKKRPPKSYWHCPGTGAVGRPGECPSPGTAIPNHHLMVECTTR